MERGTYLLSHLPERYLSWEPTDRHPDGQSRLFPSAFDDAGLFALGLDHVVEA